MGDWTGTVPTFPVGNLRSADMTTMADIDTALVTAWTAWSPTLANITQGSGGTISARYRRVGKTVDWTFLFVLGTGSAIGSSPTFTLPATPHADYVSATFAAVPVGKLWMLDAGTGIWEGTAVCLATNVASLVYSNEVGGASSNTITATAPFTWSAANADRLVAFGSFETA